MEDDAGLAKLAKKKLERAGYEIDVAKNGEEGLAMYDTFSYDVVVVDNKMPVYEGIQVIRMLASRGTLPPTVMVTGTGSEAVAVEAMKLGASDYIIKDVDGGYLELLPTVIFRVLYQKRLAEEKKHAEQKLLQLIKQTPLAIIEWNHDSEVVEWNPSAERIFGYKKNEAIGHHAIGLILPKGAEEKLKKIWNKILQRREYVAIDENLTKNGKTIICEWYHTLLVDDQGKTIGLASVVQDITERKQLEETLQKSRDELEKQVQERTAELSKSVEILTKQIAERRQAEEKVKESNKKYYSLFEKSKDVIYISSPEGKLIDINPAAVELFGYSSKEEFLKVDISKDLYFDSKDRERFKQLLSDHGFVKDFESILKRKDGQKLVVLETTTAIRDANGEIKEYQGIIRDITERKQIEEALQKAHDELEKRVEERTAELKIANDELKKEIIERKRIEEQLKIQTEKMIEAEKTKAVIEMAGATAHELSQPITTALVTLDNIFAKNNENPIIDKNLLESLQLLYGSLSKSSEILHKIQEIKKYVTKQYIDDMKIIDIEKAGGK
jgi:PAS domain S-box-containing protein